MATSNSKDVTLTLSIDTLGEENVKKLQASVAALAKEGGDAAPEFQRLVDEIAQLGAQNAAIQSFKALGDETQTLRAKQESLTQSSAQMAEKLAELKVATDAAKQAQAQATANLQAGIRENTAASVAIRVLKTEFDDTGKRASDYKSKLADLTKTQGEATTRLVDLRFAQKEANAEASHAVAALSKQQTAYDNTEKVVGRATRALTEQVVALNASSAAAEALGVSTADIAAAEGALLAGFNAVGAAAKTRADAVQQAADADQALADAESKLIAQQAALRDSLNAEIQLRKQASAARQKAADDADRVAAATAKEEQAQHNLSIAFDDLVAAEEKEAAAKRAATAAAQIAAVTWQKEAEAIVNTAHAKTEATRQAKLLAEAEQFMANEAGNAGIAATVAGGKIKNAFATVGVRSAQEIQAEIVQVREAMVGIASAASVTGSSLKGAFSAGDAKIKALELELRKLHGTLTLSDKAASLFANSMGQITAGNVLADGIGFMVNKVKEAAVAFFAVNIEAQRLSRAMGLIYGDSKVAGNQLEFLNKTADRAGVSVRGITDSFIGFSAATRASNIPLETTNAVFEATTRAAGQLGLGTEQTNGILSALGQVASKGVLQMEELRGQIGDRLPGALSIAAKGMGVTEAKLIQLVESGSVSAKVFFPAFAKGLTETFAGGTTAIDGFLQGFNRLQNAILGVARGFSDSALFSGLGKGFDFLATNIHGVVTATKLVGEALIGLKIADAVTGFLGLGRAAKVASVAFSEETAAVVSNTAANTVNTAATDLNTAAKTRNAATLAAMGASLTNVSVGAAESARQVARTTVAVTESGRAAQLATLAKTGLASGLSLIASAGRSVFSAIGGLPTLLITLALNYKELGTAIGESAAKLFGWGTRMADAEAKLKTLDVAEKQALETRRLATAAQDLLNATTAASAVLATKNAIIASENSDKEFKAAQLKAAAFEALGKLAGDEATALGNAALAATGLSYASANVTAAKQALVVATTAEIAAIKLTAGANGKLTETQVEQITKLNLLLEGRKLEVVQSEENSRLLYTEAAARRIASETYKDNSANVKQLAQQYENAKAKVEALKLSGVFTFEQINKAEIDATTAARIYFDALGDVTRQLVRTAQEHTNKNVVTNAGLNLELAQARAYESSNRALGNQYGAMEAQIQQKQIEIKQVEANVAAMRQEASDTIKVAEAKLIELQVSGQLTPELKLELETRVANSKAKQIDADAAEQLIKTKRDEIIELNNAARALNNETSARQRANAEKEKAIVLAEKENDLKARATALENKRLGQDINGFATDKAGNTLVAGGDLTTRTGIKAFLTSAGVKDDAAATKITNEFANGKGEIDYFGNAGQRKYGGSTISDALFKAAEKYTFSESAINASRAAGVPVTPTAGNNSTKTVNVVINGVSTAVNVASATDQNALTSIIRQLEAAAKGTA